MLNNLFNTTRVILEVFLQENLPIAVTELQLFTININLIQTSETNLPPSTTFQFKTHVSAVTGANYFLVWSLAILYHSSTLFIYLIFPFRRSLDYFTYTRPVSFMVAGSVEIPSLIYCRRGSRYELDLNLQRSLWFKTSRSLREEHVC